MDPRALAALICPNCGEDFRPQNEPGGSLQCLQGHNFDIARQGYVNLLTGHGTSFTPDTPAMVDARSAFLDAGHYEPLATELAATCRRALEAPDEGRKSAQEPLLLDVGTGTGYYLHRVLHEVSAGSIGLDISKFALRRAARSNPDTLNLVWDTWRPLPLAASSVDLISVVFAPRNADEFARVLRPDGALVVVTPLPDHLQEIAKESGMLSQHGSKQKLLEEFLAGTFAEETYHDLRFALELTRSDARNVVLMGPAGHHLTASEVDLRTANLPPITQVTAAVRISVFRKRPAPGDQQTLPSP